MSRSCYVLATLGTAPAVLTELLYALVAGEDLEVVGIEIWTTGPSGPEDLSATGIATLGAFIEGGAWGRLKKAVGAARAAHLPSPGVGWVAPADALDAVARGKRPFVVGVFGAPTAPLNDLRTPDDARVMDETLFSRVQALTERLPPEIALVGSLAGGRKTMSAGLQGAFSMLGRRQDRLVHVLLDSRIEAAVIKDRLPYDVPQANVPGAEDVPPERQIVLHDVHFPMLRGLLERARLPGAESAAEFLRADYATFLRSMRRAADPRPDARATLHRERNRTGWIYEITGAEVPVRLELPKVLGLALAGLVSFGGEATYGDLVQWMDDRGWASGNNNKLSKHLGRLVETLAPLGRQDLHAFIVERKPDKGRCTLAAALEGRVTLNGRDLEI